MPVNQIHIQEKNCVECVPKHYLKYKPGQENFCLHKNIR